MRAVPDLRREVSTDRRGFTLIELMIAVAIVSVLAATAVFLYTRQIRRVRATEVAVVFAEFESRQEQHYIEHGSYRATGSDETDYWPARPSGPHQPAEVGALPDEWRALHIKLGRRALYCAYVSLVGRGGEPTGQVARSFGMEDAPSADWYYLIAECDFDGRAENSLYFAASTFPAVASRNPGR